MHEINQFVHPLGNARNERNLFVRKKETKRNQKDLCAVHTAMEKP